MQTLVLDNIITSQEFIRKVLEMVESGSNCIDAVMHYCEKYDLELETAASMIKSDPKIKSKMQIEFETLNYLPKRAKLPI